MILFSTIATAAAATSALQSFISGTASVLTIYSVCKIGKTQKSPTKLNV